jgi:hypothetical protein
MRLTWKDAVTTLFTAGIVAVYVAFEVQAVGPLIDGVRGTAAIILVLGVFGGCSFGSAGELYGKVQTPMARALMVIATVLGLVALGAAIYALVTANAVALAVLFGATIALWLTATARHAFTTRTPPAAINRDVHEVIDSNATTRR